MRLRSVLCLLSVLLVSSLRAETKMEPPVPVRTVAPQYPDAAKRDGVAGVVVVKVAIDDQGNVLSAEVEKSSRPDFEQPAVEALKKWRFKPARQNGNAVATTVAIPVKFSIGS